MIGCIREVPYGGLVNECKVCFECGILVNCGIAGYQRFCW